MGLIVLLVSAFILIANDPKAETTVSFVKLGSTSPSLLVIPVIVAYCLFRAVVAVRVVAAYQSVYNAVITLRFPAMVDAGLDSATRQDTSSMQQLQILNSFARGMNQRSSGILWTMGIMHVMIPMLAGLGFLLYAAVLSIQRFGLWHIGVILSSLSVLLLLAGAGLVMYASPIEKSE